MNSDTKTTRTLLPAAGPGLLASGAAQARANIEEITVTATKREGRARMAFRTNRPRTIGVVIRKGFGG